MNAGRGPLVALCFPSWGMVDQSNQFLPFPWVLAFCASQFSRLLIIFVKLTDDVAVSMSMSCFWEGPTEYR